MGKIAFRDRPLAFTDVETTGTDWLRHEIIEIGLVVADQRTLAVIDELDIKVRPALIELAEPRALEVNGYRPEDWLDAVPLREAMTVYSAKAAGAIFMAHNAVFDWPFIQMAFRQTGVANLMDYHGLCTMSMAWCKLRDTDLRGLSLKDVAPYLGVPPEPPVHRAINGARTAYEVFKRLAGLP